MTLTPESRPKKQFRLAIIGCGLISQGAHVPAALSCSNVKIDALIDPVPERAKALAEDYGISPIIARSLDEVSSPLDGAIIATPNHTHRDMALSCFRRGISVLIEKPLANSVVEGEEIRNAARKAKCTVAVGYVSRFRKNVELLKDLLDRSYFGNIHRFVHQFGTTGGWSPLSAYNLKNETSGGGVLVVTGTHFLDRMLYLFGYPDEMTFRDDSDGGPEANCVATFNYDSQEPAMRGEIRYSKTVALPGGLILETDRGIVIAGDTDDAEILFRPHDAPDLEIKIVSRGQSTSRNIDTFAEQIVDFVNACTSENEPRISADQGLQSLKLIEDLYSRRTPLDQSWYEGQGRETVR